LSALGSVRMTNTHSAPYINTRISRTIARRRAQRRMVIARQMRTGQPEA
jgi:hypothetical protein